MFTKVCLEDNAVQCSNSIHDTYYSTSKFHEFPRPVFWHCSHSTLPE